jgi:hypothetical protein
MTDIQVTERDLQSLADKLERFSKDLSPGEHAALSALVRLATAAAAVAQQPEVSGHLFDPFTAALLAEAHHRELLAEAEHARNANLARASQPQGESVWDRLQRQAGEAADELWIPHRQPGQTATHP